MRISRLDIETFGHWRGLQLPLAPHGLSVIRGPNEAGKTTLLGFIRSVLYGFSTAHLRGDGQRHTRIGGSLEVMCGEQRGRIERHREWPFTHLHQPDAAVNGSNQPLSVVGLSPHQPKHPQAPPCPAEAASEVAAAHNDVDTANDHDEQTLRQILSHTDRTLFEHVFAFGLHELQQLASLHIEAIAERFYGISLGSDGQRLLNALRSSESARRQLFDRDNAGGRVITLLQQIRRLDEQLTEQSALRDDYDDLCRQQQSTVDEIAELKSRRAGMESQLKGHRFLERVYEPWKQVQSYRAELAALPPVNGFPDKGVEQLNQLDADIDSEHRCCNTLKKEIEQLRGERESLRLPDELRRSLLKFRLLQRKRDRTVELHAERERVREEVSALQQQLDQQLAELGEDWNEERLNAVETSPAAQYELLQAAKTFQAALVRRGRFRRVYRLASRAHRRLERRVTTTIKKWGYDSVPDAVQNETERIRRERQIRKLQRRIEELHRRRDMLSPVSHPTDVAAPAHAPQNANADTALPRWFRIVLWCFCGFGGLMAAMGLLTAMVSGVMAGVTLSLSGLTALGTVWGLKLHAESTFGRITEQYRTERDQIETQLAELELQRQRLGESSESQTGPARQETRSKMENKPRPSGEPEASASGLSESPAGLHRAARQPAPAGRPAPPRLAELRRLRRAQKRLQRRNRRLIELRNRRNSVRQQFSAGRQCWTETLKSLNLDETLSISNALEHWQRVLDTAETHKRLTAAENKSTRLDRQLRAPRQHLKKLASQWQLPVNEDDDFSSIFERCAEEAQRLAERHQQYRRLKDEIRKRRHEAAEYTQRLRELQQRRAALLAQGGARNREEFEHRAELLACRQETAELLQLAEEELREAAETESELAVVEEDLQRFEPEQNAEYIRTLEAELGDLNDDLQQKHETLGGIRQRLEQCETDRTQTRLQWQRRRLDESLHTAVRDWAAEHIVHETLERVRHRFERDHQPAVLHRASQWFQQLTGGRYQRLWTPLGKYRIAADDHHGTTWQLDELSGGTREQLFLALRLALVQDFADKGAELPLILDDVLVNFDEERTEAAVNTLLQLAEQGQQIVFLTCHQHLCELFTSRGIEPLTLPRSQESSELRRAG